MAEKSGFFNAQEVGGVYDRVYDASDFADYFANFISNGVFVTPTNQLKVVAKTGLVITVRSGRAFINGWWYTLDEDMDLVIPPNTTSYVTNTVVCCALNKSERKIDIYLRNNTNETTPIRNNNIYELVLATIRVGVGVATITDSVIIDRRPDSEYCGFVTGLIDQFDETELFKQYDSIFGEWFETIKNKLGTDIAGNLQNQINIINGSLNENVEKTTKLIQDVETLKSKSKDTIVMILEKTENGGTYVAYSVNYPDGYAYNNCYVKSFMFRKKSGNGVGTTNTWYYNNIFDIDDSVMSVTLEKNSIGFRISTGTGIRSFVGVYEYVIILEKI